MFISGTVTDALQRSQKLMWPLLLFVVDAEQLETCEALIRASDLQSSAVMQLVLVGTQEHAQFQQLVQEKETPRVHIFAPQGCRVTPLPPMALTGASFSAPRVLEAVNIAMEWGSDFTASSCQKAQTLVDVFEKEFDRSRRQAEFEKLKNATPALPGGRPSSAPQQPSQTAQPARQTPVATAARKESHCIQHYVELDVNDKRDVVFQNDSAMTLAALWDMAQKHLLDSDERCVLAELVITSPDSDVKQHVRSRSAAEAFAVSSLVAKSVVKAVLAKPQESVKQKDKGLPTRQVVCDGDVCRVVDSTPGSAPVSSATAAPVGISVRCTLPDGSHFVVSGLDASTTLADVRSRAAERLGHSDFALYNSYPPRRFTDTDMEQPLKALGLDRNATVRITMNASLASASPASSAPPSTSQESAPSMQGRLADMFRGLAAAVSSGTGNAPSAPPSADVRPPSATSRPPSSNANSRFATLASLRNDKDEEEDEPNRRKSNRYYGGSSTEYQD